MKTISIAALVGSFFISSLAFGQNSPPMQGVCLDEVAFSEMQKRLEKAEQCNPLLETCQSEREALQAEVDRLKKDCGASTATTETSAPSAPAPSATTGAPKPPWKHECGKGTTGSRGKDGHCVCEDDKILVTQKIGGSGKTEICLNDDAYVEHLISLKVDQTTFDAAIKKLNDGQVVQDGAIKKLEEEAARDRGRIDVAEEDIRRIKGELEELRGMKRVVDEFSKNRVHLGLGLHGAGGVRGDSAMGQLGVGFNADAMLSDRVGVLGFVRGSLDFEENMPSDPYLGITAGVGPIFDLTEDGKFRLYAAASLSQYSLRNSIDGSSLLGGSYGGEVGVPIQFGDSPVGVTPFLNIGGGPVAQPDDGGAWHRGTGFQLLAGAQLTLTGGFMKMRSTTSDGVRYNHTEAQPSKE